MSFVVTIDPCPTKFVGDMVDMILTTDEASLDFQLKRGNEVVLEENYVQSQGSVRISGLDKVIGSLLKGELKNDGSQYGYSDTFTFKIGETTALTKTMCQSHRANVEDWNGAKHILSPGTMDICYPGKAHPLTFIPQSNKLFTAKLYSASGALLETVTEADPGVVYTRNCQPDALFPVNYADGVRIVYTSGSETFQSFIDKRSYPDGLLFRYLNMYDVPESLLAKKAMSVKPNFTDEVALINGQQQRFAVEPDDEYTANSGAIIGQAQYTQWRELITSRQVEVLWGSHWVPVTITRSNFERVYRSSTVDGVTFSFKMANKKIVI